jgi:2-oxoglutarate dehydrogenase complex dehydrogenase (E1) component-like enzyme
MSESTIQSLAYIERFYADYRRHPNSVPAEWREYFAASVNGADAAVQIGPSFKPRSVFNPVESNPNGHAGFTASGLGFKSRGVQAPRLYSGLEEAYQLNFPPSGKVALFF